MRKIVRTSDKILAGSLLVVAAVLYVIFRIMGRSGDLNGALYAEARVDGETIGRWPLLENAELDLDTRYGHNHISIVDGIVRMTEADCPDGYCMQQTPLSIGHSKEVTSATGAGLQKDSLADATDSQKDSLADATDSQRGSLADASGSQKDSLADASDSQKDRPTDATDSQKDDAPVIIGDGTSTDPGGTMLVCLPHHLVVELVSEGRAEEAGGSETSNNIDETNSLDAVAS